MSNKSRISRLESEIAVFLNKTGNMSNKSRISRLKSEIAVFLNY
jgi:hypothetical protein